MFKTPLRGLIGAVVLLAALALGSAGGVSAAQFDSYDELGTFTDWKAYKGQVSGKTMCFMESRPTKMDRSVRRDSRAVRATVVNRPADRVRGEIVFTTGFSIAPDVFADVSIDGNPFKMATDPQGLLWLPTENEPDMIAAMRRGLILVTEVPAGNRTARDTYSLRGFTAALGAINNNCN